jgi:hypothetical protein
LCENKSEKLEKGQFAQELVIDVCCQPFHFQNGCLSNSAPSILPFGNKNNLNLLSKNV